jgi:hypothetical protein
MSKFLTLSILVLSLITIETKAQTFDFVRTSGPYIQVYADSIFRDNISYANITNNAGAPDTLRMFGVSWNLPTYWQFAICDIHNCYPPGVDTVITLYPTGVNGVSIHFYDTAGTQGAGTITIRVEKKSNPSQFKTQVFGATTYPLGIQKISTIVNEFSLGQNYPNPFNPTTKISFTLPKTEAVYLRVYDILGREVKTLVNETLTQGEYLVDFDAKDLASGMYYYSLRAGENVSVKKMVLVK